LLRIIANSSPLLATIANYHHLLVIVGNSRQQLAVGLWGWEPTVVTYNKNLTTLGNNVEQQLSIVGH